MPDEHLSSLYGPEYFASYRPDTVEHHKRRAMYRQEYARIRRYLQSGTVLDIGCGVGDFLSIFDPQAWTRYGTDVSAYALSLAAEKGVLTKLPENCHAFFDLIVFRGTLQHLDEPISTIKRAIEWLRPGGYMVFLATPNTGGICYRLFQELPMLDPKYNFMLVSGRILHQILTNLGLEVLRYEYPYLGTPYARPLRDCLQFALRCLGFKRRFAFWGNSMECYARKPAGACKPSS